MEYTIFPIGTTGSTELTASTLFNLSPWDRGQLEITGDPALPIHYPTAFSRERETLGYDPRFLPGMLTFSPENRPVMRIGLLNDSLLGVNGHTVTTRDYGTVNLIQFLGDDARWHVTDGHVRAVARALNLPEDTAIPICFGERTPDAVEFDPDGGAYTLVISNATVNGRTVIRRHLVYSGDGFQTFSAVNVPYNDARIEPWRPNADQRVPLMLARDGSFNYYIVPILPSEDGVSLGQGVKVIDSSWKPVANLSTMAGDGPMMITRGGKTFVVFMSQNGVGDDAGSPHYIVEYDHATGSVSDPVFLCTTGTAVDTHNLPVIDVDSEGYLHVICGAHWNSFMHTVSNTPLSVADGFTAPRAIGAAGNNNWSRDGLTYPAFAIDADDNLHLVARGRSTDIQAIDTGSPYDTTNQLTYINYALIAYDCPAGGEWSARQDVVTPGYNPYSTWYQKTTLDRGGNYYLLYYYYAAYISRYPEVYAEYQSLWPEEEATGFDPRAHDPVIAVRSDDSWSIATTPWFKGEMLEYIRDGAFIFPVILTITDPDHAFCGASGGWKTPGTAAVEWQDLSTLADGCRIIGQGYSTAIKAVTDIYVFNAEANYIAALVTDKNGAVTGFASIFSGETPLSQVGLGDFNADGVTDLMLRTADGYLGFHANGAFTAVQGLGTEWQVAALGDINGDGTTDIVITHAAGGYVGAYLIGQNGAVTWSDIGSTGGGIAVIGSGDFNADGTDDILIKSGNYYGAWLCGNGTVTGFFSIGSFNADVQDIGDFNADGTDDILLRTPEGIVGAALITGPDSATWISYGALGPEWSTRGIGVL